jgi:hypothetical protein
MRRFSADYFGESETRGWFLENYYLISDNQIIDKLPSIVLSRVPLELQITLATAGA